jgi:hypothetical protein
MKCKTPLIAGLMVFLSGCSGTKVDEYLGREPFIDVREYFEGEVKASGVFIGRSGMVEEQFNVVMNGDFNEQGGTLNEVFTYTDGKEQKRTWTIAFTDENHFTGKAFDVIGEAQGGQFGNAINMQYVLRVPYKDSTVDVSMDDWIYRLDEKTAINRVEMRKFGIRVGELVITFRKS